MLRYRCIKEFNLDDYDEDGFATGGWTTIPIGGVWEVDESPNRIVGGNDTIHLDLVGVEPKHQWIEILGSTLSENFELVKE